MRFMLLERSHGMPEAGSPPNEEHEAAMARFNEAMFKAGVLLAADGLQDTSQAARVRFERRRPLVLSGPFAATGELVARYWLIQAKSLEEAVEWARRAPLADAEIEVRQLREVS
jgi:hypothetical protein